MHAALGIAIPVIFFIGIGMLFHKRTRLHARLFLMLAVFLLVTATKNRQKEEHISQTRSATPTPVVKTTAIPTENTSP